jgi:Xaa-Pro aminopeptidase
MNKSTARLIIAGSEGCADLYWTTRFYVPDPVIYFEHKEKKFLVASDLEVSRAKKEAEVDVVISSSDCVKRLQKAGKEKITEGDILDLLFRERKIKKLQVPSYFPLRQAEILKKRGYKVESVDDPFYPERAIKTLSEKKAITQAIRATEAGIQAAFDLLKKSKIKNGIISYQGKVLTSEALRQMIEMTMMENGAIGQHTIVACGKQAADPHCRGFGPLKAHQTIVLDVFPKSMATGYYGDITRTVLKGRASEKLKKMYAAVKKAQEAGIRTVKAGVSGKAVHDNVCKVLNASGFKTGIIGGKPQGFIHGTGHGLGLDIHEAPRVGRVDDILKAGTVVTVEPGLYYDDLGGIRIEDDVYVTKTGCEVLSRIPKVFEIP